jgi:hypothetical protein
MSKVKQAPFTYYYTGLYLYHPVAAAGSSLYKGMDKPEPNYLHCVQEFNLRFGS